MNEASSPGEAQGRPVLNTQKPFGRTRPTNNQLLYKAYLRWEHYSHQLHGDPKLPAETEACASVTSAFLQVMSILFEVESLRVREPRNILQILSTNTRRTKVVELTSGTHRVPDELKKHSLSDGVGGQYSTNLDRNRYGADDQYLSTVIRYDLEYLRLCPCLVDVEIIDAKNGSGTILVSAGPEYCLCNRDAAQVSAAVPGRPPHGASVVPGWNSAEAKAPAPQQLPAPAVGASGGVATLPSVRPGTADPGLVCNTTAGPPAAQQPAMPGSAGKSDGSNLFDALLLAASGGRDKKQPGVAQPAEGAAGEEAQVSSKPVEWPTVPPGSKRQRSRLHQTPGSAPAGAAPEELSPHPEAEAPVRTPRGSKRAASAQPGATEGPPQPQASKEHSGENRVPEQTPLTEAGDLGSLSAVEAGAGRAGVFHNVGPAAKATPDAADVELRRLQQEVRNLKAGNKRVEASLEESRARELAAAANAEAMRAQLDALLPPGSAALEAAPSGATSAEKKVLGQATWEESKERHAQRSAVQLPRIVHTLRVEVQRLQVKIQEAEARASASQRIAEEAQRELQALVAASNSPVAGQARQAIDAEKAILRQQLMEAQAALQSVKAEKQALEECLSATASAQRHTPPSAQPAPVTPQPHRSSNPSSAKLSEGTEKKPLVSSPGEGGASALLTLSSQDAQHATPSGMPLQGFASQADPAAQSAPIPMNGSSQPMYQVPGLSEPGAAMSMPLQVGLPAAVADNYQAALAMATPEQIQQAVMALAQAASASAGGQLKPDDLQALFGPQWATLVAMPGGAISLPPDQLQQLAASEAPHALAQLVAHAPGSQPALAPPATAAMQPEASQAQPAVTGVQVAEGSAAGLQQKPQEQAPSAEFDISQVLNLSGGSLPTSA